MLKEASLITRSGVPIWVRTTGPSIVTGILTGAMLGALSMFSSEITGKRIRSIEMSDGFLLHVRPFEGGELNLAIVGEGSIFGDPELLTILERMDAEISIMLDNDFADLSDPQTITIYLENAIEKLDSWFGSKLFLQTSLQNARTDLVVEISSQIALMASRFTQENVGILILDASLESVYQSTTKTISQEFLASLHAHLKSWIKVSSHDIQLMPEMIFFSNFCVGIKPLKQVYIVVVLDWEGSIGDQEITGRIRSWLSSLARRLGP